MTSAYVQLIPVSQKLSINTFSLQEAANWKKVW